MGNSPPWKIDYHTYDARVIGVFGGIQKEPGNRASKVLAFLDATVALYALKREIELPISGPKLKAQIRELYHTLEDRGDSIPTDPRAQVEPLIGEMPLAREIDDLFEDIRSVNPFKRNSNELRDLMQLFYSRIRDLFPQLTDSQTGRRFSVPVEAPELGDALRILVQVRRYMPDPPIEKRASASRKSLGR